MSAKPGRKADPCGKACDTWRMLRLPCHDNSKCATRLRYERDAARRECDKLRRLFRLNLHDGTEATRLWTAYWQMHRAEAARTKAMGTYIHRFIYTKRSFAPIRAKEAR
jgi:hypothetical protein